MIDPELKEHLTIIQHELQGLRKGIGAWRQLGYGILSGMGYIIGAAAILVVIGWILNIIGVIPALTHFVTDLQNALNTLGSSARH